MKEIVPKDSRYIPFVQQKSCCVPACILMIMYRNGISLMSQELLGYHLGLTIRKESSKLFWNPRTGKRPSAGWGTQIYKNQYHPNTVFAKLKIPLKMIYHSIDSFTDKSFRDFLVESMKKDKDMIVCFDHGNLTGTNKRGGHVCLFDRVCLDKNEVRIIDPSSNWPKWRIVKLNRLKKAMELHGGKRSGGFWEFRKTA